MRASCGTGDAARAPGATERAQRDRRDGVSGVRRRNAPSLQGARLTDRPRRYKGGRDSDTGGRCVTRWTAGGREGGRERERVQRAIKKK